MKNNILIFSGLLLLIIITLVLAIKDSPSKNTEESTPLTATYVIEGESFTLVDGHAEKESAPGSASKNIVSVFGEPVYGDMNNDGVDDALLILTSNSGGSGTFYYAAVAVNVDGTFKGTDTILLGDRVAPQNSSIENGIGIFNYADRAKDESFTVQPSIGKTLRVKVDAKTLQLGEVANNFEGESSGDTMKLSMKSWKWIEAKYTNKTSVTPKKADAFNITFKDDGKFSATTDCNGMSGTFKDVNKKITFGPIASTLMFCEGSQEQIFSKLISEEIDSYDFTNKGELVFRLKNNAGTATFK